LKFASNAEARQDGKRNRSCTAAFVGLSVETYRASKAILGEDDREVSDDRSLLRARPLLRTWTWVLASAVLAIASFLVGRTTADFRSLPEIVATLPGDESAFGRELDARLHERFPVGSNQESLVAYLANAGFLPEWPRRDGFYGSSFIKSGTICTKIIHVVWRANSRGILTDISGSYESRCI
jgi:hypothetical protein